MKNTILFCLLILFCTLGMFAQEIEKVLEIKKRPNLRAEEKTIYDSVQHQNHDVEIYRSGFIGNRSYHFTFYLVKDDKPKEDYWVIEADEHYDRLYYHWESDTVFARLENSGNKEHMGIRVTFNDKGSRMKVIDRPE